MASTRLNSEHRLFLRRLAAASIKCHAEEAADRAAYEKAAPRVRQIVEAKYPPKDMQLLKKYAVATADGCIKLNLTAGGVVQFEFRGDDMGPLRPATWDCGRHIYAADQEATTVVQASLAAHDVVKKAHAQKTADYYALITHSVTLEQVEAVWPAASALRAQINRALPVVLSEDVVARIRADVAAQ